MSGLEGGLDGLQSQLDDLKDLSSISPPATDSIPLESSSINNNGTSSVIHTPATAEAAVVEQSFDAFNEDIFNKLSTNSKGRMKLKGLSFDKSGGEMSTGTSSRSKKSSSGTSGGTLSSGSIGKRKGLSADLLGLGAADLSDIKLEDNNKTQNDSSPRCWRYKHHLKSHFDGVRSLEFHPNEPVLISASEDHTIKIWNLNHLAATKKGHDGPVFTTSLSDCGTTLFSGGYDMVLRQWTVPPSDIDPYTNHGRLLSYLEQEYIGHTDAVWDMLTIGDERLASASSDGTVILWDVNNATALSTHTVGSSIIPTTLTVPPTDTGKMLIGYSDGSLRLIDLESGVVVRELRDGQSSDYSQQLNKVVSHALLPLAITGSEDNKIEFWDLTSCSPIHSMIAHSDAVSSLTIDPSGLYLASCSHDSAIRFWDISSKTCIQDCTSHRPKFDESIHTIKYHPTKGYFASGGADSIIRIHQ
eukprot:gene15764-18736_t